MPTMQESLVNQPFLEHRANHVSRGDPNESLNVGTRRAGPTGVLGRNNVNRNVSDRCCPTCGTELKNQHAHVDLDTNTFLLRDQSVRLRPKEAEALAILVRRAPGVVTNDTLASHLWGITGPDDTRKNVQVQICRIRQVIAPLGASIVNVWDTGYRFVDGSAT